MARFGISVAADIKGQSGRPLSGASGVAAPMGTLDEPEPLCTSGQQNVRESTGPAPAELPWPYFDGQFDQTIVAADHCRIHSSGDGFSFRAYTKGVFEMGHAENERGMYFRAADETNDIHGFYRTSMSALAGMGMDISPRGIVHLCEGCSAPEHGMDFEMLAFLRTEQLLDGTKASILMGESLAQPLRMQSSGPVGGQGKRVLDGRPGFSMRGNPFAFDAVYKTISPLTVRNHDLDNETIIGGELAIPMAGGDTYQVTFGDGFMMVNGDEASQADMERLQRHCAFDDFDE